MSPRIDASSGSGAILALGGRHQRTTSIHGTGVFVSPAERKTLVRRARWSFLEAMFPHDGQTEDRHATGQNHPMAERQRMAVDRSYRQRDLVVARYEVGNELE